MSAHDVLQSLAPSLCLAELQAISQLSRAFRQVVRDLPAEVWRASLARTVPAYHPLAGSADVQAAATRHWAGCAGLLHGRLASVKLSKSSYKSSTPLHPDFCRQASRALLHLSCQMLSLACAGRCKATAALPPLATS